MPLDTQKKISIRNGVHITIHFLPGMRPKGSKNWDKSHRHIANEEQKGYRYATWIIFKSLQDLFKSTMQIYNVTS